MPNRREISASNGKVATVHTNGMSSKRKIPLRKFISREFFKAALLPLLIIEVTLLALYFLMNAYLLDRSIETLGHDRLSHLMGITESQARIIDEQLRSVADLSKVLQSTTTRFFQQPDTFPTVHTIPRFEFSPEGVYYKRDNDGGCSLFYSNRNSIGPKEKEKAQRSEALDPFYKGLYETNRNIVAVYLNTFDSMSRYYPFFEDVHEQLPPDMNIPEYNFYYMADKEHNPEAGPVWTAAYLDPMGMGWMMSCLVPIYRNDFLEGVAGIDITVKNFIGNLLSLDLPWQSHAFLVDEEGTIMAMPPSVEHIFGIDELDEFKYLDKVQQDTHKPTSFNLLASVLSSVHISLSELMGQNSGSITFSLDGHRYVLCQNTVLKTGWKLMVIADRTNILRPISRLEHRVRQAGYAAVGFMFLFYILFFLYLANNTRKMSEKIARPIGGLARAIQGLATGTYQTRMEGSTVIELDELSNGFQSMSQDLKTLHDDLEAQVRHANAAEASTRKAKEQLAEHRNLLEKTVEERTQALARANRRLQEDIARRKRAEQALDFERQQLLSVFDSIDEIIYISSPDNYELLYVNEAFKKYWPDALGKKCYEVIQNLEEPCSFCTNSIIFGEKMGRAHIWEYHNPINGMWARCIDKAIQWPDGQMVRYEMAIDITEQKEAAQEKQRLMARIRRAEKMEALGTLAGGVAHDLNNVLGGIVGYPDLLLLDMPADHPLRRPVETIRDSGLRATAIVQDLLTLARRGVAVMEPVNLNDAIDQFLRSPEYQQMMQTHPDVRIEISLCKTLLNCNGSPVHLSKMIMNLLANAVEAMPGGGEVRLATTNRYVDLPIKGYEEVQEGDYTVLRITDTGSGIEEEDLERIFEPFYTKKKMGRSGTGLGMAVVWGTVKDHNGYIEIQSAVDKGTTIEIYLPATRHDIIENPPQSDISDIQGNGETVLVVDDVAIQREIAADMLRRLGYTPHSAASGEEAVAYLTDHRVDLLLLDMIMDPNMNGLETYRQVSKIHPDQKAIIVSGFSETAAVSEAQGLGAGKYLKKPYTIQQLGQIIKEMLS